ncbi:MAG: glycosyltransferase family 9 protein [Gemmatimonadota bacterium]|nr:glycosyltransferase family 9 protein [Gemmatimonadota bacterium]MDP6529172.1 glycosyltransferase family 9 protein [Gemmatimonadota bacterium]MDP6802861.1 glycosyltransferase family 9 protein [Gemmatimonadota bacterium]MDP7032193.1 glycosyltransferase family 9 protein [Gemmatimonadota bacterium]
MQIPFLYALRTRHPQATIRVVSPVAQARAFTEWGLADEVRLCAGGGVAGFLRLVRALRRHPPDLLLQLRRWSPACSLAAAVSPGRRVGFAHGTLSRLLDERHPYDDGVHLATRYLSLVDARARGECDTATVPLFREWMNLVAPPEPLPEDAAARPVLLMPGAGNPEKRWPLDRFLSLAGRIPAERFVLLLGPGEVEERAMLLPLAQDAPGGAAVLPTGVAGNECPVEIAESTDLVRTLALVRGARLTISNDCGPSHIAQLSGGRFLGLYRPESETLADWFLDRENADLLCAPAGQALDAVSVEAVAEAAGRLLEKPACAEEVRPLSDRRA